MRTKPIFNFTPFPVLETERLLLRKPEKNDDYALFVLRSNDEVNKLIPRVNYQSIEEAQNFLTRINNNIAENDCIFWMMELKETNQLIATICLWNLSAENSIAEIGYEMHPDFHGKGYMQEAVAKVIDYGFSVMKVQTIFGVPFKENIKSVKLLESFNFKRDMAAEQIMHNNQTGKQVYLSLQNTH